MQNKGNHLGNKLYTLRCQEMWGLIFFLKSVDPPPHCFIYLLLFIYIELELIHYLIQNGWGIKFKPLFNCLLLWLFEYWETGFSVGDYWALDERRVYKKEITNCFSNRTQIQRCAWVPKGLGWPGSIYDFFLLSEISSCHSWKCFSDFQENWINSLWYGMGTCHSKGTNQIF